MDQKRLATEPDILDAGDLCPECYRELEYIDCESCNGTGKDGDRDCLECDGDAVVLECPNCGWC